MSPTLKMPNCIVTPWVYVTAHLSNKVTHHPFPNGVGPLWRWSLTSAHAPPRARPAAVDRGVGAADPAPDRGDPPRIAADSVPDGFAAESTRPGRARATRSRRRHVAHLDR